jgi:hypothetical protein
MVLIMVLMETAREDSQEQSWLGASMQARAEEIEWRAFSKRCDLFDQK